MIIFIIIENITIIIIIENNFVYILCSNRTSMGTNRKLLLRKLR